MPADVRRDQPPKLTLYGRAASPAAMRYAISLTRGDVPFEWVELRSSEQARQIGIENLNDNGLPVCVFSDGARMENPTIRQILEKLGWFRSPSCTEVW